MNGGTDGEGGSFYGMAPVEPELADRALTAREWQCCYCSSRQRSLRPLLRRYHHPQSQTSFTGLHLPQTPRTILTARRSLLDDTAEGVLQGLITDDFEANDPLRILTPGGFSPGGATPQELSLDTPVSAPAPEMAPALVPAPAASQATATGTDGYAMQPRVTRAVTRSQVRSTAAINYWANRNNRATLASLFQKDTVQQAHKLGYHKPGSHVSLDIAPYLDDTFSTGNAYANTNTKGLFSAGEQKEKTPTPSNGYGPCTSEALESGIG